MRNKGRLIAAVAAGVVAVVMAWLYIGAREAALLSQSAPQTVVVATADIPGNSVIEPGMFEIKSVPSAFVQPRAVTKPEDVQGRVAVVPIAAGMQVLATMLGDESEGALAYEVPSGMRALTIGAADVSGVGGLVRPGNRVDILGTFEFGREEGYWIVWHPAGGKRTEGSYRHGTPVGHWQRWDEHGQLIAQQTFAAPPGGDVPAIATHGGAAGIILRR